MTIFLAGTTGQSHKQSDFGKLFLAKSLRRTMSACAKFTQML